MPGEQGTLQLAVSLQCSASKKESYNVMVLRSHTTRGTRQSVVYNTFFASFESPIRCGYGQQRKPRRKNTGILTGTTTMILLYCFCLCEGTTTRTETGDHVTPVAGNGTPQHTAVPTYYDNCDDIQLRYHDTVSILCTRTRMPSRSQPPRPLLYYLHINVILWPWNPHQAIQQLLH